MLSDITGKWEMSDGFHLVAVQIDDTITGKFYHSQEPKIWGTTEGKVEGATFKGKWKMRVPLKWIPLQYRPKSESGNFEFKVSDDGKLFEGILFDHDSETDRTIRTEWTGTKN